MNKRIEQLEAQLAEATEQNQTRVDFLNSLAWELWTTDRDRSLALTLESFPLAKKLKYEKGIAFSTLNYGLMEWQNNIEKAMPYFLDALQWFEENNEIKGEADAKGILSIMYWGFGDFQRGFDFGSQALELYKKAGDLYGKAWTFNSLGGFFYDWQDYQQSLEYFKKGCRLFRKLGHCMGQARALNGIGNAFLFMGDPKKALDYQNKGLKILQENEHKIIESRILNDLGLIYQSLNNFDKALGYHQQSLAIRQKKSYYPGETTTLIDIGNLYLQQNQPGKAQQMLEQALTLSQEIKAKPKIAKVLELLSQIYEQKGDYSKALEYQKNLNEISREAMLEDTNRKMKNIKAAYKVETSKKEAEIYRLKNVELKNKNEKLEDTLKKLNAAQAQLVQSGKMIALGNLVAGIAHELNTPIGTIKSGNDLSERVADNLMEFLQTPDTKKNLPKFQKSITVLQQSARNNTVAAERIINIIQSLKKFAHLDEAEFIKADINAGIESALTLINHQIKKQIQVKKSYGDLPSIFLYASELNQVFMNLLMNALQATQDGGVISIKTFRQNGNACIRISDNGRGIPPEKLPGLFEPGFTTDNSRVKMRTGLYTSYSIINKHKGKITVESKVGKGATFTISIPLNLNELVLEQPK